MYLSCVWRIIQYITCQYIHNGMSTIKKKSHTFCLLLRHMEHSACHNNNLDNILLVVFAESCKPSYQLSAIFIFILYLLTYLLTPWSRVLLEKLTGFATNHEIPRIYGTRKFITVLTSARHLFLSYSNQN